MLKRKTPLRRTGIKRKSRIRLYKPDNEMRRLDALWSRVIVLRDRKCLVCGTSDRLEAHHIIARRNIVTRYDPDNGITLCQEHHTQNTCLSPHAGPAGFKVWAEAKAPHVFKYISQRGRILKDRAFNLDEARETLEQMATDIDHLSTERSGT